VLPFSCWPLAAKKFHLFKPKKLPETRTKKNPMNAICTNFRKSEAGLSMVVKNVEKSVTVFTNGFLTSFAAAGRSL